MATAKKAAPAKKTADVKEDVVAAPAAPIKAARKKAATTVEAAPVPAEPAKRKPNAAFMKAMKPSKELAAVIGATAVPRTEVTKKIWVYIKSHKLQDATDKRLINADAKLKPIFGKAQVTMFEMTKLVNAHLS